jgi:hypothetical protein
MYLQRDGVHSWQYAANGTAGNTITFTQAMTLDASNNLFLGGTTSSYTASNRTVLAINGTTSSFLSLQSGGTDRFYAITTSSQTDLGTLTAIPLVFNTNATERARIDSSGNLLVGKTNSTGINAGAVLVPSGGFTLTRTGTSSSDQVIFYRGTAGSEVYVGTITTTGTATSYVTSSDYRLKNSVAPMTGALAKVALLKPCTYKWNADGSDGEGFIAHELAEVVPQAVSGEKDALDADGNIKPQGIDTSFLVATLTAAIQEQQAMIESLRQRLSAANL